VAWVVGAGRRQGEGAAPSHEGVQAHEIYRLLEALADLRIDTRVEIGGLVRIAPQRSAEKRVGRHDLTLAMLRSYGGRCASRRRRAPHPGRRASRGRSGATDKRIRNVRFFRYP